jgi:hypothetical protein
MPVGLSAESGFDCFGSDQADLRSVYGDQALAAPSVDNVCGSAIMIVYTIACFDGRSPPLKHFAPLGLGLLALERATFLGTGQRPVKTSLFPETLRPDALKC